MGHLFVITKWVNLSLLQSGTILLQSGTGITKWDDFIAKWDGYYKGGRFYYKVGQLFVITKWDRLYYKVGQLLLLQSGTILLQSGSGTGITKWDDYYKVCFNT